METTLKQAYSSYIRDMAHRQGLSIVECKGCYPYIDYARSRQSEILADIREDGGLYNLKALDSLYREYGKGFVTQLIKFACGSLDWYSTPDIRTQPKWGQA